LSEFHVVWRPRGRKHGVGRVSSAAGRRRPKDGRAACKTCTWCTSGTKENPEF
jgi:hypothetical protein